MFTENVYSVTAFNLFKSLIQSLLSVCQGCSVW